jgi:signal transduction histidine kinase
VRVEPRAGGTLIVVEDAGPGVPAEVREAVFQPFQRGPSITAHAPGSGIGLALVAQFAAMHGGRAWVEERPRGGASFRVLLCDDADAAPEMRPL